MSLEYPQAWFAALGEPLGEAELADLRAYLAGLGFSFSGALVVKNWTQACEIASRPAEAWWEAEEAERARLQHAVSLDLSAPQWLEHCERLHGAAAIAAARQGFADPAAIRAAAGAATLASYQFRLAHAAGASSDHPFVRKYALFCGGRWLLGLWQSRFAIF